MNSEFEGNKQKDGWRVNAMLADTSRKGHPRYVLIFAHNYAITNLCMIVNDSQLVVAKPS